MTPADFGIEPVVCIVSSNYCQCNVAPRYTETDMQKYAREVAMEVAGVVRDGARHKTVGELTDEVMGGEA